MSAVDPTYPLYPIACILAAAMILLVLLNSFVRQNWNLGVAFLCFWLFWENLTFAINAIIWSDNADIKLYVYCDIVSHMQTIAFVVKPMGTLIITRRLYLITSLRSVELPDKAAKRRDLVIEWTLGLVIPVLVTGLYYLVQQVRFAVLAGFGCQNAPDNSVLSIFLIFSWPLILPVLSATVYYPRVIRTFYRQSRDINHFLRSNDSVSRTNYFRIFALASIDVILTLPTGITDIVLTVTGTLSQIGHFPLYQGWVSLHTHWEPVGIAYAALVAEGTSNVAQFYFSRWSSIVLAFVIFGLFGITAEARALYWRIVCTVGGWFGCKPTLRTRKARSPMGTMKFGERPQDASYNLDIDSQPSYINPDARVPEQDAEGEGGRVSTRELGSNSPSGVAEELREVSNDAGNVGHPAQYSECYECEGARLVDPSNAA